MPELGIPVFNTPGANANAVKELVICGMLLGSRKIVDGINHMYSLAGGGEGQSHVWGEGVEGKDAGGGGTGTRWICKNEKVAMKILTMTLMQ